MDIKLIVKQLRKAGRSIAGKNLDAQVERIEALCKEYRDAKKTERKAAKSLDRGNVATSLDRSEG